MKSPTQLFYRTFGALAVATLFYGSCVVAIAQPVVQTPAQNAPPPAPAAQVAPAPMQNPMTGMLPTQAQPAEDIRDIRGPKAIPSSEMLVLELIAAALLAVAAYTAWRWYQRSRQAAKLPYQIALERLEKARALMQPATAREFSIEASETVRSYVEARFHVFATNRTTEEFLRDLVESTTDTHLGSHQPLLADFLTHCDLAKFARWVLSPQEMEEMLQSARTFITQTGKPSPAPAKKPQTVSAGAVPTAEPAQA